MAAVPHADQPIRPASTVCVLRRREVLEVLMVERARSATFVGGAFVFPGGAVDEIDHGRVAGELFGTSEMSPYWSAAVRETFEEAGVVIPAGSLDRSPPSALRGGVLLRALHESGYRFDVTKLAWLSNWVTPRGQPRRFDTRFFVTVVPADTKATPDLGEVVHVEWVSPAEALARHRARAWRLPPPTVVTLKQLGDFDDPDEVVAFASNQAGVPRIAPRMLFHDSGAFTILMPGDPSFDEVEP